MFYLLQPALRTLAQLVIASDTTVLSAGGATRWATMSAGFSGDYGLRNGLGNGGGKTQADSGEGRDTRRAVGRGLDRSRGSYKCQNSLIRLLQNFPRCHKPPGSISTPRDPRVEFPLTFCCRWRISHPTTLSSAVEAHASFPLKFEQVSPLFTGSSRGRFSVQVASQW
ncbi:hypothetical protein B0H10DRAFT_534417 [Mycena sp. CBHHK59/15]|nr:hypothetical protein B0H10DRAFT_534417 [Mycena sp. CBHHK59/15]